MISAMLGVQEVAFTPIQPVSAVKSVNQKAIEPISSIDVEKDSSPKVSLSKDYSGLARLNVSAMPNGSAPAYITYSRANETQLLANQTFANQAYDMNRNIDLTGKTFNLSS